MGIDEPEAERLEAAAAAANPDIGRGVSPDTVVVFETIEAEVGEEVDVGEDRETMRGEALEDLLGLPLDLNGAIAGSSAG
jgi:hypothetical protein